MPHTPSELIDEIGCYDNCPSATEDDTESIQKTVQKTYVACKRGGTPGGAYSCGNCGIAVHPFCGCSFTVGNEEGYGEIRVSIWGLL